MKRKGENVLKTEETSYKANRPKRTCRKDTIETSNKEIKFQKKAKDNLKDSKNSEQKQSNDSVIKIEKSEKSIESTANFSLVKYLKSEKWLEALKEEFELEYFKNLNNLLKIEYSTKTVYPPKELIFNAFNLTDLDKIKVVILGQDPYHDLGQAEGLAFSVPKGIDVPRSLKNIFKELQSDMGIENLENLSHGCLHEWCSEGVFLMNTILTVEEHKPGSHAKLGWEIFTDKIIQLISENNDYCVFLLWGNAAHKKEKLIDSHKHGIIKCAHPSPLSFNKFLNSKCFSKANNLLFNNGKGKITWNLTP